MPRPRSRRRAQIAIYETVVENPELEAALKRRESVKEKLGIAKNNLKVADDNAQKLINDLELGIGAAVRVGDFVISKKARKGGHVEFDRNSSEQTRIKFIGDAE
jgi:hypothetical protein